jgi:hypothetical protein
VRHRSPAAAGQQNTGEVKTDRNGQTVYQVGLSAADGSGRVELVNVNVSGEPQVRVVRWTVYNLIRSDQLRTIKIGRRRLVPPAALDECVELLGKEAA